jgi:hypothetical protein
MIIENCYLAGIGILVLQELLVTGNAPYPLAQLKHIGRRSYEKL